MIESTLTIARYCSLVIQGFSNFLGLFQGIMANPVHVWYIYPLIYHNQLNVGPFSIHGWYGNGELIFVGDFFLWIKIKTFFFLGVGEDLFWWVILQPEYKFELYVLNIYMIRKPCPYTIYIHDHTSIQRIQYIFCTHPLGTKHSEFVDHSDRWSTLTGKQQSQNS